MVFSPQKSQTSLRVLFLVLSFWRHKRRTSVTEKCEVTYSKGINSVPEAIAGSEALCVP